MHTMSGTRIPSVSRIPKPFWTNFLQIALFWALRALKLAGRNGSVSGFQMSSSMPFTIPENLFSVDTMCFARNPPPPPRTSFAYVGDTVVTALLRGLVEGRRNL